MDIVLDHTKGVDGHYPIPKKWWKLFRMGSKFFPYAGNQKDGMYYLPQCDNNYCVSIVNGQIAASYNHPRVVFDNQFIFKYRDITETKLGGVKIQFNFGVSDDILDDPDIKGLFVELVGVAKKEKYTEIWVRGSSHSPTDVDYNCIKLTFFRTEKQFKAEYRTMLKIKPLATPDFKVIQNELQKAWQAMLDFKIKKAQDDVNIYTKKLNKLKKLKEEA